MMKNKYGIWALLISASLFSVCEKRAEAGKISWGVRIVVDWCRIECLYPGGYLRCPREILDACYDADCGSLIDRVKDELRAYGQVHCPTPVSYIDLGRSDGQVGCKACTIGTSNEE